MCMYIERERDTHIYRYTLYITEHNNVYIYICGCNETPEKMVDSTNITIAMDVGALRNGCAGRFFGL